MYSQGTLLQQFWTGPTVTKLYVLSSIYSPLTMLLREASQEDSWLLALWMILSEDSTLGVVDFGSR